MLKSMTGFAKKELSLPFARLSMEIQSLNRKFLDFFFSLPSELSFLESDLRKKIAQKISRGQVNIRISLSLPEKNLSLFLPSPDLLSSFKKSWEELAKKAKIDSREISLSFLIDRMQALGLKKEAETQNLFASQKKAILHSFSQCIETLLEMKVQEGTALSKDLLCHLALIEKSLLLIKKEIPHELKRRKEKIKMTLESLGLVGKENEERLLKELFFYIEKSDVEEEIIRLKSHLSQFTHSLKEKESLGKKLEFLLQEILREINTLGSKTESLVIIKEVLNMKAGVERIREQIQNVE